MWTLFLANNCAVGLVDLELHYSQSTKGQFSHKASQIKAGIIFPIGTERLSPYDINEVSDNNMVCVGSNSIV